MSTLRVTQTRVMKSEWTKLRTQPGALWSLLSAVILVGFLPGSLADEIGKYLPGTAGLAVTTVHPDPVTSLGPWTGFGVFCAYALVLLGAAAVRMRRGDA